MRQLIIISFAVLFLASCSKHKVIKYQYKGVTITRVDKDAQTYFYYGDYNQDYPKNFIKAEYSGYNNGMEAYLIFQPNKEVEIIHIMGIFNEIGYREKYLYLKEYDNIGFMNWRDSLNENYNNVVHIVDGINDNFKTEKLLNERNYSKVKAIYQNKKVY